MAALDGGEEKLCAELEGMKQGAGKAVTTTADRALILVWIMALLGLAGIYAPVMAETARLWRTDQYAGHGMFVLLYAGFIAWADRHRLREARGRPDSAGILATLGALGILAVGRSVDVLMVEGLSLVVAIAGLVLWGFGARCLKLAAFPIAFLVLMMPLPRAVVDSVSLDLRLFAAGLSAGVLRLLGIPSYLHGTVIELRSVALDVAQACDGLRFLMALLTLTMAFAQVSQRSLQRKLLLVAAAVPMAILANVGRVIALALVAHYFGPGAATGWPHHLIGKSVWALAIIPLAIFGLMLARGGGRARSHRARAQGPEAQEAISSAPL